MKVLICLMSVLFSSALNAQAEQELYHFEAQVGRSAPTSHRIVLLDSKGNKVWETSDFSNGEYVQGATRSLIEDLNIGVEAGYIRIERSAVQGLTMNGRKLSELSQPYTQRPALAIESMPKKGRTSMNIVNKYREKVRKLEHELNQCRTGSSSFVQVPESESSVIQAD